MRDEDQEHFWNEAQLCLKKKNNNNKIEFGLFLSADIVPGDYSYIVS